MELSEKVGGLPKQAGVYLFKDAMGTILYVGKAGSLRNRVKSYFLESKVLDAKTGSLVREIADLDYIVVDNEREALALENNLIKQYQPKFNVLLRDDKTYPYIRYTAFEKFPRVYVTRRLRKDGSLYFGPFFPHSLAHRIVHFIHKHFRVPSCTVDLTRNHPRACLQYYINRCWGPCVEGLVTIERYAEAARDTRTFLEGKRRDLIASLKARMAEASEAQEYEQAGSYRDLLHTLEEIEEKQKIAAAEGDDTDVLAWYAEPPQVAANVFHLRGGRVVDRRDYYWEDQEEFDPAEFLPSLLKQMYLDANYLPRVIHVPCDFEDRALLSEMLSERAATLDMPYRTVEIAVPQRGPKHAFLDLVENNARHSFEQRFRVMKPNSQAIAEALEAALNLPSTPRRIESFDISHVQGSDVVASMVVWEDGKMKKSDYRKFIIRGPHGAGQNEDSAAPVPAAEAGTAKDNGTGRNGAPERAAAGTTANNDQSMPAGGADSSAAATGQVEVPLRGTGTEVSEVSDAPNATSETLVTIEAAETIPAGAYPRGGISGRTKDLAGVMTQPFGPGANDDFASMREAVSRRYRRLRDDRKEMPSLILIDGGIGQLHAAAQALDELEIINQPVAAIAKQEELLYVLGQEDEPVRLDKHSPVLHLIQQVRDETHRFAVTFHRARRSKRALSSALHEIPGVGAQTARRLLRRFGSVAQIRRASVEELATVVPRATATRIAAHLQADAEVTGERSV